MFPFKARKTRWEIARDTVLDAAHDAADIAAQAATVAAVKAGTAATSATITGKQILGNVEDKLQNSGEVAQHFKENLSDSFSRGAQVADERAHKALERAQETAQTARETAQTAREAAAAKAAEQRDVLVHKKDDLAHTLHDKSEHAREVAAQTAARLGRKREVAAATAVDVAANVEDSKRYWFQRGSAAVEEMTENARDLAAQKSDELSEVTKQSRKAMRCCAKEAKKAAARLANEHEPSEDVRVEIEEGGSNTLWIVIGLAIGAVVALLLWPKIGRRNRAALQDKFDEVKETATETVQNVADKAAEVKDSATETVQNVADKAADKAEDLSRRADGLAHEIHVAATDPIGTDTPTPETPADDITIADRVRSELGQTALGELSLNIDSVEGNVSVRGALPNMTTQVELEAIIRAIPGVRDVIFDTPAPDAPPREDSLNHQTEIAERVTESHLADTVAEPEEQPKDESPAEEPFVG